MYDLDVKKIFVEEHVFSQLPADVKLTALILRKLGRLEIVSPASQKVKP